jgi:hypothetical protein
LTIDDQIFTLENFQIAGNGADGGHSYILAEVDFKNKRRKLAVFFANKTDEQKLHSLNSATVKGELSDEGPHYSLHLLNAVLV